MTQRNSKAHRTSKESKTVRASISFPAHIYHDLELIAEGKKVSLAWVVREAAEKYVADQWPLLGMTEIHGSK